MTKNMAFKSKTDSLKTGGLLTLAYGSFLPYLYISQSASSISEYALRFAIVSSLCVAFHSPYIQGKITGLFNKNAAKEKETMPLPQTIADDIKALCQKAEIYEEINVESYGSYKEKNAEINGKNIYIGNGLLNNLSPSEIKFVVAHEISHIKASDYNERSLFQPALRNAQVDVCSNIIAAFILAAPSAALFPAIALSYAAYKLQDTIISAQSRHQEYRADRNTIHLTKDFKSAATALVKIHPEYLKKTTWFEHMFSAHPRGISRLQNMERESTIDKTTKCSDLACKIINDGNIDPSTLQHPENIIKRAYKKINEKSISSANQKPSL